MHLRRQGRLIRAAPLCFSPIMGYSVGGGRARIRNPTVFFPRFTGRESGLMVLVRNTTTRDAGATTVGLVVGTVAKRRRTSESRRDD